MLPYPRAFHHLPQLLTGDFRMRRFARYALLLCCFTPAPLVAQGFGVYEHGTCTMGRSGTAAASPCNDGSAIFSIRPAWAE